MSSSSIACHVIVFTIVSRRIQSYNSVSYVATKVHMHGFGLEMGMPVFHMF